MSTKDCPPNMFWEIGFDDFDHICKISCSSGDLCEYDCGNVGSVTFDELDISSETDVKSFARIQETARRMLNSADSGVV